MAESISTWPTWLTWTTCGLPGAFWSGVGEVVTSLRVRGSDQQRGGVQDVFQVSLAYYERTMYLGTKYHGPNSKPVLAQSAQIRPLKRYFLHIFGLHGSFIQPILQFVFVFVFLYFCFSMNEFSLCPASLRPTLQIRLCSDFRAAADFRAAP